MCVEAFFILAKIYIFYVFFYYYFKWILMFFKFIYIFLLDIWKDILIFNKYDYSEKKKKTRYIFQKKNLFDKIKILCY